VIQIAEPTYLGRETEYVLDAIERKSLSQRDYVERFEKAFAAWVGTRYAVACNTGTAALHLALLALGVGPGDEVIVPACTYVATANAVRYCGAEPVVVDVVPDTWTLDWEAAFRAVTPRTKGFLPVHLYGMWAGASDPAVRAEASRRGHLFILEDAAEAHGATEPDSTGGRVGSYGRAGAFSFYANKILTCGEGGMVTTSEHGLYQRLRSLRGVGQSPLARYVHTELGFNYRMTDPAAALGLAQLERADEHLARRRALGDRYRLRLPDALRPAQPPGSVDWVMPVLVPGRDTVAAHLKDCGIETRPVFPPLNRQPIYRAGRPDVLPVSERLWRDGLLLPLHCGMDEEDVDMVSAAVLTFAEVGA
jgi:perosamine synthetase